ncbi:MAG: EamA family transporter [Desulfobacterales bacterium]|nr:MAG: EamA family transporter [Desulfobacterales bacterium]
MKDWFLPAIFIPLVWGFWGLFPKLAVRYISPTHAMAYQVIGNVIFGIFLFAAIGFRPQIESKGIAFAILAGICGMAGAFLYLLAVGKGKVSIIVFISAMYPVVTIALSYFFLHETITLKEGIGMIFALVAIILFST